MESEMCLRKERRISIHNWNGESTEKYEKKKISPRRASE